VNAPRQAASADGKDKQQNSECSHRCDPQDGDADLVHFQPDVLLLPPIERLFGNSHSSEQLHQRYSGFCLLQHCDDLFDAESLLLHGKILLFQVQILPKY
jgi:hypothetical protein